MDCILFQYSLARTGALGMPMSAVRLSICLAVSTKIINHALLKAETCFFKDEDKSKSNYFT